MKRIKSYEVIEEADIVSEIEKESNEMLTAINKTEEELQGFYTKMTESEDAAEYEDEVNTKLRSYRRASDNIFKAYRKTISVTDELGARYKDLTGGRKRKLIPKPPANSVIDLEEERFNHFAKGLNIYKILIICYVGSFAGVLIEILWCLITRGYLESRSGLVYGPFNLLYGLGAVAMTLTLYGFRNKGKLISFLGGFLVGSVVEYACSMLQEIFFGSRSWDYSNMPFNLNGRICVLYSIYWGILGIVWVKSIYPRMAKLILKIPEKVGKIMTWLLLVFFVLNSTVTVIAVYRWSQRTKIPERTNSFWQFVDKRFPDERMEKIFANMEFAEN